MALHTYAADTGSTLAASIREDLIDIISNIDPADTPFFSMIESTVARSTTHEWLLDDLEPVSAAGSAEGTAFAHAVTRKPVRQTNSTQILRRDFAVTDTMRAVDNAGMTDAFAYQLDKGMRELARNTESALLTGTLAAGTSATARVMNGLTKWTPLNTASAGSPGDPLDIIDTTTQNHSIANLTETTLNTLLERMWDQGAKTDTILANAAGKVDITGFTAGSTIQRNIDGSAGDTIRNSIMYYQSDFGNLSIHLSRHNVSGECYAFQRDLFAKAFLQPTRAEEYARTTDAQPGSVYHEVTLEVRNSYGLGRFTGVT